MSKTHSYPLIALLFLLLSSPVYSQSNQLDPVTGVQFDGTDISWDPLPGATGYNVHLNFDYLDTVSLGTSYTPTQSGRYYIAAFDELGNFSPLQIIENDVIATTNTVDVELSAISTTEEINPPANLSGTVYSLTAGELFWDRVNFQAIEYDVTLNGEFLGTTEGTSFFVDTLVPESQNIILVYARNESGQLSEPAALIFETFGSDFPLAAIGEPLSNFGPNGLTPPNNPRLTIYSLTAAELMWERADADENIVSTEISRDGEVIGTTEGNSFYDDNRESGQAHFYELVSVNGSGERSSPSIVRPNPFDGDTASIVNRLLTGISDVTARNPHQRFFPLLRDFTRDKELHPELVLQETAFIVDAERGSFTSSEYDCATGSVAIESVDSRFGTFRMFFDMCSSAGLIYDGNLSIVNSDLGGFTANYNQLTIQGEGINARLSGEVLRNVGRAANFAGELYRTFVYELIDSEQQNPLLQTTRVELTRLQLSDNLATTPRSTFRTEFTVTAAWTFGQQMNVGTAREFRDADLGQGNYLSGELIARGADGQELLWDAGFPDNSSWYATVRKSDSSFSIPGEWSDEIRLPCLSITFGDDAIPGCAGL